MAFSDWPTGVAGGTPATYNVQVTRVRSTAAEQQALGLPPPVEIRETPFLPRIVLAVTDGLLRFPLGGGAEGEAIHQ